MIISRIVIRAITESLRGGMLAPSRLGWAGSPIVPEHAAIFCILQSPDHRTGGSGKPCRVFVENEAASRECAQHRLSTETPQIEHFQWLTPSGSQNCNPLAMDTHCKCNDLHKPLIFNHIQVSICF
jgi:hypothetical protein